MNEGLLLQENIPWLLVGWVIASAWGHQVAVYRAFVDRIRAGASTSSEEVLRKGKLIGRLLDSDNEFRPWSVEAATLSALQITLGFLAFYGFFRGLSEAPEIWTTYCLAAASFLLVLLTERTITGILGPMVAARPFAAWHMRAAAPSMHAIRLLCKPLRHMLAHKENFLCAIIGKEKETGESEEEVAEHIKTLQEEGSELHPEIREIVGNTLDLRNLDVQDAIMPRNQVRFLDANDSVEENLSLARSCGHTRLPLCDGDLDRCLGIVHVKDIFRLLAEGKKVDLRNLARQAPNFSPSDPLPAALRKLLQHRAHMAMVLDEFGGTVGALTLEDILEEVVGEIRDEFDVEEDFIIRKDTDSWRVSGMAPVHELPDAFDLGDKDDDAATFGGTLTGELGRIPEPGERVNLGNLLVTIEEADDTRVIITTVRLKKSTEKATPKGS
jgi:CBS domain containing-hemolysin-like protein